MYEPGSGNDGPTRSILSHTPLMIHEPFFAPGIRTVFICEPEKEKAARNLSCFCTTFSPFRLTDNQLKVA